MIGYNTSIQMQGGGEKSVKAEQKITAVKMGNVEQQSHLMLLAETTAFQEANLVVPDHLWNLLTVLNLTVALWTDNSTFSLAITSIVIFKAPVLHFNSNVDLRNLSATVVLLALGQPSSIDSVPQFYPVPKRRVLLVTDSFNAERDDALWNEHLNKYQRTRFVWFNLYPHPNKFKIFTISYEENEHLIEISSEEAINIFQDLKPVSIPNFHGREILVTLANYSVQSYVAPGKGNQSNYTDGIQAILFYGACELMNLKPKALVGTGEYGRFANGTFTEGMQRDVMEMKSDVLVAGTYFKQGMMGLVEMSNPWGFVCVRYLVPRPKILNSVTYVIMNVFSLTTWLTTMGTILLVTALSTLVARSSRNAALKNYCSVVNSFLAVTFQLLQIKHPRRPEYTGFFFPLLLAWGWFGFLLTSAYNSELAASFTKPRFSDKIQTDAEFIKYGYKWGSQDDDLWWLLFDMDNPTTRIWVEEYYEREKPGDRERKLGRGDKYILVGHTYGKIFYYRDQDIPSDQMIEGYEVGDNCITEMYTGIMFPPGSPYLVGYNVIKSRLLAAGIQQKLEYDVMLSRPLTRSHIPKGVFSLTRYFRFTSYVQLKMSTTYAVFYILLIGYSISAVVFIRELVTNRMHRNRKRGKVELRNGFPLNKAYQQRYYVFRITPLSK